MISVSFQRHKNFQCDFQCNNFIVCDDNGLFHLWFSLHPDVDKKEAVFHNRDNQIKHLWKKNDCFIYLFIYLCIYVFIYLFIYLFIYFLMMTLSKIVFRNIWGWPICFTLARRKQCETPNNACEDQNKWYKWYDDIIYSDPRTHCLVFRIAYALLRWRF